MDSIALLLLTCTAQCCKHGVTCQYVSLPWINLLKIWISLGIKQSHNITFVHIPINEPHRYFPVRDWYNCCQGHSLVCGYTPGSYLTVSLQNKIAQIKWYALEVIKHFTLDLQIYNRIYVNHIFIFTILSRYIPWAVPITQCIAPITHSGFLTTNIKHVIISLLVELEVLHTEHAFKSAFVSSVLQGFPAVFPSVIYANGL